MSNVVERARRCARSRKKSTRPAGSFGEHKFNLAMSRPTPWASDHDVLAPLVEAQKEDRLLYLPNFPDGPPNASGILALEEIGSALEPARGADTDS